MQKISESKEIGKFAELTVKFGFENWTGHWKSGTREVVRRWDTLKGKWGKGGLQSKTESIINDKLNKNN